MTDNGSVAELPWAAVFDPRSNARALTKYQAEGIEAANRLVDRILAGMDPEHLSPTLPKKDATALPPDNPLAVLKPFLPKLKEMVGDMTPTQQAEGLATLISLVLQQVFQFQGKESS